MPILKHVFRLAFANSKIATPETESSSSSSMAESATDIQCDQSDWREEPPHSLVSRQVDCTDKVSIKIVIPIADHPSGAIGRAGVMSIP